MIPEFLSLCLSVSLIFLFYWLFASLFSVQVMCVCLSHSMCLSAWYICLPILSAFPFACLGANISSLNINGGGGRERHTDIHT